MWVLPYSFEIYCSIVIYNGLFYVLFSIMIKDVHCTDRYENKKFHKNHKNNFSGKI